MEAIDYFLGRDTQCLRDGSLATGVSIVRTDDSVSLLGEKPPILRTSIQSVLFLFISMFCLVLPAFLFFIEGEVFAASALFLLQLLFIHSALKLRKIECDLRKRELVVVDISFLFLRRTSRIELKEIRQIEFSYERRGAKYVATVYLRFTNPFFRLTSKTFRLITLAGHDGNLSNVNKFVSFFAIASGLKFGGCYPTLMQRIGEKMCR